MPEPSEADREAREQRSSVDDGSERTTGNDRGTAQGQQVPGPDGGDDYQAQAERDRQDDDNARADPGRGATNER
ncbi:MAG TPA: hypothetical protein VME70_09990 [Mycobacteriales bacterium]|nr:hypothetical protein [Mycobacteriales bacterium]